MRTTHLLKRLKAKNPETLTYDDPEIREFMDRVRGGQIKFINGPTTGWAIANLFGKTCNNPAPYVQALLPYAWFKEFPYLGIFN